MRCLCVSFFVPDISFRIGGVLTDTFCLPRLHPFRMKSRPERRWRERTTRQHAVRSQNTVKRTRIHARTTGRQPTTSSAVLRLPLSPPIPVSTAPRDSNAVLQDSERSIRCQWDRSYRIHRVCNRCPSNAVFFDRKPSSRSKSKSR